MVIALVKRARITYPYRNKQNGRQNSGHRKRGQQSDQGNPAATTEHVPTHPGE